MTSWRISRGICAAGSDGIARSVDGGKALEIDGNMVLCGRSDDTAQRGYTGSLAELAIWNTALTAQQVSAIYTSVSAQSPSLCQRLTPPEHHYTQIALDSVFWLCMDILRGCRVKLPRWPHGALAKPCHASKRLGRKKRELDGARSSLSVLQGLGYPPMPAVPEPAPAAEPASSPSAGSAHDAQSMLSKMYT